MAHPAAGDAVAREDVEGELLGVVAVVHREGVALEVEAEVVVRLEDAVSAVEALVGVAGAVSAVVGHNMYMLRCDVVRLCLLSSFSLLPSIRAWSL